MRGKMDKEGLEAIYLTRRANFLPWEEKSDQERELSEAFKAILKKRAGAVSFGKDSFVSPEANVFTNYLKLGERSWIAAGAIVRGNVTVGNDTTINPYAHIAGNVTIGNCVMIAGLASIYGFNHGYNKTDVPIQYHTSKGIQIMDDVWIGASAVIIDGVKVAAHTIVGAGSIVTKDFPEYSIIGGNPARFIKCRLESR